MEQHWTQNFLNINGKKMHYIRTGNGEKKPMILVHGFSDSGFCWSAAARELEADHDIIMPDMRGHGLSARVDRKDENVDMALDLAELIKSLNLDHPVIIGHSMGAVMSFEMAVRFPDLPGIIILEDPPWGVTPPFDNNENPIAAWAKTLADFSLEELIENYTKDNPSWPEETIRYMCESKKQLDTNIIDIMTFKAQNQEIDWKEKLPGIRQPLLVLGGDPKLGAFITPEVIKKINELKADAKTVAIPDVGHLIKYDKFSEFILRIKIFLLEERTDSYY